METALASQDENAIRCAMTHAFNYIRQLSLLGDDSHPEFDAAVSDFAIAGLQISIVQAQKRCTQDHDFTALQDLLGYVRQALLYGIIEEFPDISSFEKQCPVSLRLDFTSQMRSTYP